MSMTELQHRTLLAVARDLAGVFGAKLACHCGRAWIDDNGDCPACRADAKRKRHRRSRAA